VTSVRTGVVLFNLGGPDSLEAVEPFLVNLFNDPAIIRLPQPFRYLIARTIAHRRAPVAKAIYERMGGRSTILDETNRQVAALEAELQANAGTRVFKVVAAMRYSNPRSTDAAKALKSWSAEEIVLLPLYPQFSTTTTASSFADWDQAARGCDLRVLTRAVCCWPAEPGFVTSVARKIAAVLRDSPELRVLFSAHGLPERIVESGDPYPSHVAETVRAVIARLNTDGIAVRDWRISYQSRVGPLKWIGPSTDEEIRSAGNEGKGLVVVPIAFVSEHSETLVELDHEYRKQATAAGVPRYERVATPTADPEFIAGLARLVNGATRSPATIAAGGGDAPCSHAHTCPRLERM
jgi:ferrochelatase